MKPGERLRARQERENVHGLGSGHTEVGVDGNDFDDRLAEPKGDSGNELGRERQTEGLI